MSLIACTSDCVYQRDGYCQLECAGSIGIPTSEDPCLNYVPTSKNRRQRLPDIFHGNEL